MNSNSEHIIVGSAIGDALGWITEFVKSTDELQRVYKSEKIKDYLPWKKIVGGRFQGYEDHIERGDYSDDTQLTISTAVCIDENGRFDVEKFAKVEFPHWLEYARGAGGNVKEAAEKIQRTTVSWNENFFQRKTNGMSLDYRDAGANGVAMRISPHVIANPADWQVVELDIWKNAIVSHGHPRAIWGALIYARALVEAISGNSIRGTDFVTKLGVASKEFQIPNDQKLIDWLQQWNSERYTSFEKVFEETRAEVVTYLRMIWNGLEKKEGFESIYKILGCQDRERRGSGISTVLAGLYVFLSKPQDVENNILAAVNMIGTDTDTIASFVGGMSAAAYGIDCFPDHWILGLQDHDFLSRLGKKLATKNEEIFSNFRPGLKDVKTKRKVKKAKETRAEYIPKNLLRAEIKNGMRIDHITLGPGNVKHVETQKLRIRDKEVVIARINFDIGQSCVFAFRNDEPIESFTMSPGKLC